MVWREKVNRSGLKLLLLLVLLLEQVESQLPDL